jgi:hypothetical protein
VLILVPTSDYGLRPHSGEDFVDHVAFVHLGAFRAVFSDELSAYLRIGREFSGGHHRSFHKAKEYVRKTLPRRLAYAILRQRSGHA